MEYASDLWNVVDFIMNTLYVTWIVLRATAVYCVMVVDKLQHTNSKLSPFLTFICRTVDTNQFWVIHHFVILPSLCFHHENNLMPNIATEKMKKVVTEHKNEASFIFTGAGCDHMSETVYQLPCSWNPPGSLVLNSCFWIHRIFPCPPLLSSLFFSRRKQVFGK